MNPIKMTLLVLGVWVIATFVWVHFIEDVSEKPFAVVMYSIYLAPFICTIAFIVSAFFYRTWINSHRRAVVVVLILIIWQERYIWRVRERCTASRLQLPAILY